MNLLELLAEYQVISGDERTRLTGVISAALKDAPMTEEQALLQSGIEPKKILDTLSAYYKIPSHLLGEQEKIEPTVLQYIPEESARHYRIVPIVVKEGVLVVGCVDPDNLDAVDALNFISTKIKLPYKIVVILEYDFALALKMYENLAGEVNQALNALESELSVELIENDENKKQTENEEI